MKPQAAPGPISADLVDLLQRAGELFRAGRFLDSAELYQQVIKRSPKLADVHNNLGVALKAAGHVKEAVPCFKRAVRLKPDYRTAHANLASALEATGKLRDGLEHRVDAWRLQPSDPEPRSALIRALRRCPFDKPHPTARSALVALQDDPDIDQQSIADPAARLWSSHPGIRRVLQAADHGFPDGSPGAGFKPITAFLADGLIIHALSWSVLANPLIEALLTRTRRHLLGEAVAGALAQTSTTWLAAIALQARASEWVWSETDQELEDLAALEESLAAESDLTLDRALIRALYRPLESGPQAEALRRDAASLVGDDHTPLAILLRRSFVDPAVEARIAERFRPAAEIEDATSQSVRSQYEDNPYPRWLSLERRPRRTLDQHLADVLALAPPLRTDVTAPRVLVAGCGTGRHALQTALRYHQAEILAIDLSANSLAYAQRMADQLAIRNITFAQADLLTLDGYSERFDLIESSGVLHHMADPMAGWTVLRSLLDRRGLMRLAFYSRRARVPFDDVRRQVPRHGSAMEKIRAARRVVLDLPEGHAARALQRTADFYSASGVRDALLHTHEVTVDPLWIEAGLKSLDLDFLGFELPDLAMLELFRQLRPADPAGLDLETWDAIEAENPDMFLGMYQFWARARD